MLPRNTSGSSEVTGLSVVFGELVRLEIELWEAVDARLGADCDLTLGRFLPLQVIGRRPGCRVQDIAEELAITVGGTSKVIDRIVAAGHCSRSPKPGDKRSSLIFLTAAGERVLTAATAVVEDELERRIGSVFSPGDLQSFGETLSSLRAAVRAPADGVPS
jgi:DNA-binding MarR family transcriptional regulator